MESNYSDEQLLAESKHRPYLFAILLDRYEAAFLRKALSILRNKEEAEEVVQDAFTKIYLHADTFDPERGGSFSSWGYKILMNTAFTRYQKRKRESSKTAHLDPEIYEILPDTHGEKIEDKEIRDYVLTALAKMPETLSRVLSLHFLEGLPQKEIAKREQISVGAVKTRVYRAKEEFRKISNNYSAI